MRLIDADALAVDVLRLTIVDPSVAAYADAVLCLMQRAPTIDAEPVRHGTWETSFEYDWDGNKLYIHFHRECGFEYRNYLEDEAYYCARCGAKMDGGVNDEWLNVNQQERD